MRLDPSEIQLMAWGQANRAKVTFSVFSVSGPKVPLLQAVSLALVLAEGLVCRHYLLVTFAICSVVSGFPKSVGSAPGLHSQP